MQRNGEAEFERGKTKWTVESFLSSLQPATTYETSQKRRQKEERDTAYEINRNSSRIDDRYRS